MTKFKKLLLRFLWLFSIVFILMNAIAFIHAYTFTHFSDDLQPRIRDPKALSFRQKATVLFLGVNNPRPAHKTIPSRPFDAVILDTSPKIESWHITIPNAKGTVILFHGYTSEKSALISRSDEFIKLGYNTLLVDFMGSGGSEGSYTTIGFQEAEQVKFCYDYILNTGEKNIYLFGVSMGAVAILKAIQDYALHPEGVILECPFGSLYDTVCKRFDIIGVPRFPMAYLLSFWGGVQHGYWAFSHNPARYATAVKSRTLLLYGEEDDRVSKTETDLIFKNLPCEKKLASYPYVGHNIFTESNKLNWIHDIASFMK